MTRVDSSGSRRTDNRQAGFGLSELMIATAITLVVLIATMGALSDGIDGVALGTLAAETHQNARAGVALMRRDLLLAGQGIPIGGIPIPSGPQASPIQRPGPSPMTFPSDWVVLPSVSPGADLAPPIWGRPTDMLTMVYADSTLALDALPVESISADGGTVVVPASIPIGLAGNGLRAGDLVMFTNAMGFAVQEVTFVSGQVVTFGGTDSMRFNQRNAGQGTIMQLQSSPGVFPPTTATRIWMISYYINEPTPGQRQLIRRVNNGEENPIALDVDDLQLTYDLVDGLTNPTGLDEALAPQSPAQIRKVNLQLSTRSSGQSTTTRQHQQHSLSTSVSLRSLSFTDRYQ